MCTVYEQRSLTYADTWNCPSKQTDNSLVKQFSQILKIVKSSSFMPMLCTSKTDCLTYTIQQKCLLVLNDQLVPSKIVQTLWVYGTLLCNFGVVTTLFWNSKDLHGGKTCDSYSKIKNVIIILFQQIWLTLSPLLVFLCFTNPYIFAIVQCYHDAQITLQGSIDSTELWLPVALQKQNLYWSVETAARAWVIQ